MKIYVLNAMAFDGVGPSQTCMEISEEMARAGHEVVVFGTRRTTNLSSRLDFRAPIFNALSGVPYRISRKVLSYLAHNKMARQVPKNSIVYAWPSVDFRILENFKRLNCKIFLETINIHTLREKKILEEEMVVEGFQYTHYVTEEKIINQIKAQAAADCIFASNEAARASIVEAGIPKNKVFLTRYGAKVPEPQAPPRDITRTVNFVFSFVGRISMEKGVHRLLQAWRIAGVDASLHLYGNLDRNFFERYRDLFELPGVRLMGFTNNVHSAYGCSDAFIFLSLAEGGPLVSIEAALHGLPLIVSPMGGGRIAKDAETALVVDPRSPEDIAQAIRRIYSDKELRQRLGLTAQSIAKRDFTWEKATRERLNVISSVCTKE